MSLLKVSDNYSASIVGNFAADATTLTVDIAPVKTAGYLTVFDLNGNQFEKIKYDGVSGLNLTGCIRGLSFDDNSDTPVVGNAKELKNGMAIKMTVSQHYLNPVIDFVNQYNGKWMDAVANFAALPQPATDGEVRVTLDDSKLYVYDLDTTTWNLAGAGGGAGTVYITTKLGTEAEGDDNKTFELNSGSFPDKKYFQVYKNGVLQEEGATADYVATGGNQAVFNDAVLDTDKITLIVISVDIYNPAWNLVDGDILPDVDATHDIGSSSKKFKDGYFSGSINADEYLGDGVIDPDNLPVNPTDDAYKLVVLDSGGKLVKEVLDGVVNETEYFNPGTITDNTQYSASQDFTITQSIGIIPKRFEAVVIADVSNTRQWTYSSSGTVGRSTFIIKGSLGGNCIYFLQNTNSVTIAPNSAPSFSPFSENFAGYGVKSTTEINIGSTAVVSGTMSIVLKSVTVVGTNIVFTFSFVKTGGGGETGVIRYGVQNLAISN